jgi:hypothetical protein
MQIDEIGSSRPFFKIKISQAERIWIEAVWEHLNSTGKNPEYNKIRLQTKETTGSDFSPLRINENILRKYATEITCLGALNLETGEDFLATATAIIQTVQGHLLEDAEKTKFTISEIAKELGREEQYIRIIFKLISDIGHFYTATGSADPNQNLQYFTIEHPDIFERYISFINFNDLIKKRYFNENAGYDSQISYDDNIIGQLFPLTNSPHLIKTFVNKSRIDELNRVSSDDFDLSKLRQLCNELNSNYLNNNLYSIAMLTRAIIDHIPPIFKYNTFTELANDYESYNNSRSFKKSMTHLNNSSRSISDSVLHSKIRKIEATINSTQIDFKNDLDVLLGEVVRILKH